MKITKLVYIKLILLFQKLLLAFFVFSLTACQTANIRKDYSLGVEKEANKAIIFGSVTQNLDTGQGTTADFRINKQTEKNTILMYSKETNAFIGAIANRFDFEDTDEGGRIFVLEINIGTHQLDYWSINHNNGHLRLYPKVPPPELEFTISQGDIMYIGNLHINIISGKNWLGMLIPSGGDPSINNKYERDVDYLYEKYPQFKGRQITINVLHEGEWKNKIFDEEELVIPTSN